MIWALEISPNVAFALIDRMLGGHGQAAPVNRPNRTERRGLSRQTSARRPGRSVEAGDEHHVQHPARETRPQMLQVAAANEGFVVVSFHVQVGDAGGGVNLCIPSGVVETASAQFQQAWPKQRREVNANEREWIDDHLSRAPLVVVPMIRAKISGSAALALKPGQVLTLPLAPDRPIDVFVGGLKKMTGRLAAERGRVVVAVEDRAGRPVSVSGESVMSLNTSLEAIAKALAKELTAAADRGSAARRVPRPPTCRRRPGWTLFLPIEERPGPDCGVGGSGVCHRIHRAIRCQRRRASR
jgi:flagellar motor switch protein FliM